MSTTTRRRNVPPSPKAREARKAPTFSSEEWAFRGRMMRSVEQKLDPAFLRMARQLKILEASLSS